MAQNADEEMVDKLLGDVKELRRALASSTRFIKGLKQRLGEEADSTQVDVLIYWYEKTLADTNGN